MGWGFLSDERYVTGAIPLFGLAGNYIANVAAPFTLELQAGYAF